MTFPRRKLASLVASWTVIVLVVIRTIWLNSGRIAPHSMLVVDEALPLSRPGVTFRSSQNKWSSGLLLLPDE